MLCTAFSRVVVETWDDCWPAPRGPPMPPPSDPAMEYMDIRFAILMMSLSGAEQSRRRTSPSWDTDNRGSRLQGDRVLMSGVHLSRVRLDWGGKALKLSFGFLDVFLSIKRIMVASGMVDSQGLAGGGRGVLQDASWSLKQRAGGSWFRLDLSYHAFRTKK